MIGPLARDEAVALAFATQNMNISLLVALGFGGLSAALWGPLVLGVFWRGLTAAGGIAGFVGGAVTFVACVGKDAFGAQAVQGFEADGIDTTYVFAVPETPSGVALIMVGALLGVGVQGGSQVGFASLVDLNSGNVVWFNRLARAEGDLRKPAKAQDAIDHLLDEIPL